MQYDLTRWRGFFFQAGKDSGVFKRQLFLLYLKKIKPALFLYCLVREFKNGFFGPVVGLLFYLGVYLLIRFPQNKKYVSMVELNTEKKSYRDIFEEHHGKIKLIQRGLVPSFSAIKSLVHRFSLKQITADFYTVGKILKRYDLFIALRSIQYLAYYDRFVFELDAQNTDAIIVFTDANPHGRALLHSAYKKNIKLCFVSHGEPIDPIFPIHCDIVYLFGERSLLRHQKNKSRFGRVLFHGHKNLFKRIREIDFEKNLAIGLFLSKSTRLEEVSKLSFLLKERFNGCSILIRRHPNMALSKTEERLLLKNSAVYMSDSESIDSDIEKCDFVIAGDSTVHLDILLRGRPSLYYRNLEENPFDKYGYVEEGIILDWNMDIAPDVINNFYQDLNTKNRISYFLDTEKDSFVSIREINEAIFK